MYLEWHKCHNDWVFIKADDQGAPTVTVKFKCVGYRKAEY